MATHKIDPRRGVMDKLEPGSIQRGWERNLLQMRMCLRCGKFLHPKLWAQPCAWTRPEYRLERLGLLGLGRIEKEG